MNLICRWTTSINNDGFKDVINKLNIEFCAYMYDLDEDKVFNHHISNEPIYIYEKHNIFAEKADNCIPLDEDLIISLNPYYATTLDILYRWRRNYILKEEYKTMKQIYFELVRYWNDFIITRKIDCFIMLDSPHTPMEYIIYSICKVKNIPVVLMGTMPLFYGNLQNCYFKSAVDILDLDFDKRYELNKCKYLDNPVELRMSLNSYFREYSVENNKVNRVVILQGKSEKIDIFKKYINRALMHIRENKWAILSQKAKYLLSVRRKTTSILRYIKGLERIPDFNQKYLFFPLHFQPEATTVPDAGVYAEQLMIVEMISKCLPENTYLYVKEHPAFWMLKDRRESMSEVRSRKYYDQILRHKNVRIIAHDYDSLELIEKSIGVVTATGTAGWEAIFKGKQVMAFGNSFYSFMDGIYRIRKYEECQIAISQICNNPIQISKKDIQIFLKTMERISIELGNHDEYFVGEDFPTLDLNENNKRIANGIYDFMKLSYKDNYRNKDTYE